MAQRRADAAAEEDNQEAHRHSFPPQHAAGEFGGMTAQFLGEIRAARADNIRPRSKPNPQRIQTLAETRCLASILLLQAAGPERFCCARRSKLSPRRWRST